MFPFANLIDALNAAPADRLFITHWIDEDERESVTFEEFRRRARQEAAWLRAHGLKTGERAVIIMPQGIAGMSTFVAAMMLLPLNLLFMFTEVTEQEVVVSLGRWFTIYRRRIQPHNISECQVALSHG